MNRVNTAAKASPRSNTIAAELSRFVQAASFPCLGAKSALARGQIEICVAGDVRSTWDDLRVAEALFAFARKYARDGALFQSFAVVYDQSSQLSELEFERRLWQRLQSFSDKDSLFGARYDRRVTSDPSDQHFSLSFGGIGFFVVGLHPHASRPARRFAYPTLIFNAHEQFEELRRQNKYEGLRDKILARDLALAGTLNPMLARHGEMSEARQYSGRAVDADWKCPFRHNDYAWRPRELQPGVQEGEDG